jgi:LysM domain
VVKIEFPSFLGMTAPLSPAVTLMFPAQGRRSRLRRDIPGRWLIRSQGRSVIREKGHFIKNRLNLAVAALFFVTGLLVWVVARDHRFAVAMAQTKATAAAAVPTVTIEVQPAAVRTGQTASPPLAASEASSAHSVDPVPAPVPQIAAQTVPGRNPQDGADGDRKYVAKPGDTLSDLVKNFFGSGAQIHQDAIIASNPSLQANPDRIIAGQTYIIPAGTDRGVEAPFAAPQGSDPVSASPSTQPVADGDAHQLRYSARPGDSVSVLAGALLGGNNSENRNAIIAANPSIQANPDRIIAGKTYHIDVQPGQSLAAAPIAARPAIGANATPTTQPDADQVVAAGSDRELRYTAVAGDTVSTLAVALLGSDSQENEDAIVNSNASLKKNPDRVIAGQTYWIPAPGAAGE